MNLTELEKSLAEIEVVLGEKRKILEKAQKSFGLVIDKKQKIQEKIRKLRADDLEFILFDINAFQELQNLMPFPEIGTFGYWGEKVEGDKYEQCINIRVKTHTPPSKEALEFIEKWLKVSKMKSIVIQRFDCGEDMSLQINFLDSGEMEIEDSRRPYIGKLFTTTSKKDLFDYIASHHPCEAERYRSF